MGIYLSYQALEGFDHFGLLYINDPRVSQEEYCMKSKVTINDIAEKAGVSIATVSRILNQKGVVKPSTQKKVLQAMEELQYDTTLVNASASCRLLLAFIPDFANPFYARIIDGIQQTAHENNFEIFLVQTKDIYSNSSYFFNLVKSGNFSGVLWISTIPPIDLLTAISHHCPSVMCCEYPDKYETSYVSIDDISSAYKAVNYLISTGCRKIGLINCSLKYKYARHRREGYLKALNDVGLSLRPEWNISIPYINYRLAYSSVLQVLNSDHLPDAFFACSDVFASAAINAARHCHIKVPEELSVIGFDNVETSRITSPTITTISQPAFQLGQQSCSMLIEKISNPSIVSSKHLLLDTELIIRGSTRKFL